ncbi:MAG TPA: AMP-binding protein [Candidatus Polarisedimenticolia bacterium]|nr:AMP-binding protein [Candidatus Polarisedimenticolia bacterium]
MLATRILDEALERRGEGCAVACGGESLSYADARRRILRLSATFRRLGVSPGERIVILHRNCHRFFETYFAALHCGAILAPVNPRLAAPEMKSVLEDAGVSLIVSEPSTFLGLAPVFRRLPGLKAMLWTGPLPPFKSPLFLSYEQEIAGAEGPDPLEASLDDSAPAHLYYTSGSSGAPKGVVLTRGNLAAHAHAAAVELGLDRDVAWGHFAPMFHLADAWAVWAVTQSGGSHVFLPEFSASGALALLESGKVNMTNMVPTMYHRILREPGLECRSFPGLRLLLSGGAAMPAETVMRILAAFRCEYAQTYGLTETSPFLTLSRPDTTAPGSLTRSEEIRLRCTTGRPLRGVQVRVVDEAGAEVLRDGQAVGEIQARGPTVTPGYWNNPAETAASFEEGWLKTGDLAVIGPEGYLTIVDRMKDLINTGGEKVYSLEVENALAAHPQVAESAVVAVPHPELGEAVLAVVVLRSPEAASPEELIAHCARHLTYFKVPKAIRIVVELPKTASGKVLKRALREKA